MFKDKLRENRKELELTKTELAKLVGVTKDTVSNWELGVSMPDLENIIKLSEIFGVSTDFLLKDRKSNSDFSYYTVEAEKQKSFTTVKLMAILTFTLAALAIFTLFVITFVAPITYVASNGSEYHNFIAYLLAYNQFLIAFIFLVIVLTLAILAIFTDDEKLARILRVKI
ncbi:MAG: helix-turn-helix transcriptional regulator [Sphaerochaetaceae bacterium]|nr:helix-turn-helix transcriptional regulator [Sphaerochaetaceae bacterium]